MNHLPHGGMPGMAASTEKAPSACDTEGLTTDRTNNLNFATDGTQRKNNMNPLVLTPTPDKAAILAALTIPMAPAYLFGRQPQTTKGRRSIHAIHEMMCGDFLVFVGDKTIYCKDLEAVQAFAKKLRMSK